MPNLTRRNETTPPTTAQHCPDGRIYVDVQRMQDDRTGEWTRGGRFAPKHHCRWEDYNDDYERCRKCGVLRGRT